MLNSVQMTRKLEKRLQRPGWRFSFDKKNDKLRIEDEQSEKGITLSLPGIISKYDREGEAALDDIVYHVEQGLTAMSEEHVLNGKEKRFFPVIRATSFPTETNEGKPLLYEAHTAETRIYYALDLDRSYRLIDREMMTDEQWTEEHIREMARFNLRSLENPLKKDEVAGNTFYFLNENDGYDASRILNQSLLEEMNKNANGQLTVAVPHQDVLIFGDIENNEGYDVLGQMTMSFFSSGRVPITALPFIYEDGKLEPIFIMARKKPEK